MTEVAALPTMVITETLVTETIHTDPVPVGSVQVVEQTNGTSNGTTTTNGTTNGAAKKAKKEVVVEPPKDPKEDPIGWAKQQISPVIHKINYHVLEWIQKQAEEDESKHQPLPGKNQSVTKSQFVGHLQDGTLLAQLANKLSPGSVATVHEGEAAKEKDNQTANLQAFINFAKEKAGLSDDQVFSVEDLQAKGKAGYEAVFNTIFQIATNAQEKFNQTAFDVEKIAENAKNSLAQNNLFQRIINLFKRVAPSSTGKQVAQQGAADENTAPTAATAIEEVPEPVNKVEATASKPVVAEPATN